MGEIGIRSDLDYYAKHCPIERSYQGGDYCSGTYNNGAFKFYPPFSYKACQCDDVNLSQIDDLPPTYFAQSLNMTREDINKTGNKET